MTAIAQARLNKLLKEQQLDKWDYLPYQINLTNHPSHIRVIIGGNRTGKTEWGAKETSTFLLGTHPSRQIIPPIEAWIGTPSFDLQLDGAQRTLLKFIREKDIDHADYLRGNIIQRLYLKNGSVATFKSYEQGAEKFQSAGKRLIWFDEEPPHPVWTESVVRHEAGVPLDIILTMTPVNGMTWVYDEIYMVAESKGYGLKTPTWEDNIHLTQDQIAQMTSMLTAEELEVRKAGRFVRKVGLVCPWWRRDVHVQDLSNFDPRGKTVYVGGDFGFTSSYTAFLFVALHEDCLYLFDGIYELGLTTNKLAERLKEKLSGVYITKWIGDSAQAEDLAELRSYGITIEGIKKETGNTMVNWDDHRARKFAEYGTPNPLTGKPRIIVSSNLMHSKGERMVNWFVEEVENLRWKTVRTPDGQKATSLWGDTQKDAIDAFSYILCSLPQNVENKFTQVSEQIKEVPNENLFNNDGFY